MPLDTEDGAKALQLITSRYDAREWRKKIEKTLSLPQSGIEDDIQRKIFLHLKRALQAYKSRRADAPSWIVGGYATKEVIDRAKHRPDEIDPTFTTEQVAFLGVDPGADVDQVWWEDMLVKWFEGSEEELEELPPPNEEGEDAAEAATADSAPSESAKKSL
ncbi:hypothetical protein [Candidatus Nitronereus thalassa]|uniref:Uncharacterized protein n=1 Tax=Candidatus Nitronereus thalassa TaxID=3020898 RepID=A0ABU3K692_9BACT|nr:hypothetical protein [Candidatus Nitronereus thalassa]MDT7041944.1 hypothetical protein [Candidatus Nitronereus thalassa]